MPVQRSIKNFPTKNGICPKSIAEKLCSENAFGYTTGKFCTIISVHNV